MNIIMRKYNILNFNILLSAEEFSVKIKYKHNI